jgi:hypothetical protein
VSDKCQIRVENFRFDFFRLRKRFIAYANSENQLEVRAAAHTSKVLWKRTGRCEGPEGIHAPISLIYTINEFVSD